MVEAEVPEAMHLRMLQVRKRPPVGSQLLVNDPCFHLGVYLLVYLMEVWRKTLTVIHA